MTWGEFKKIVDMSVDDNSNIYFIDIHLPEIDSASGEHDLYVCGDPISDGITVTN